MDSFYIIVGSIALVILIGVLTFLGIAMNKQYVSRPFPERTIQKCPDYWQVDGSYCVIPTIGVGMNNIGTLGTDTLVSSKTGLGQYNTNFTPGYMDANGVKKINFTKDNDADWKTYNTTIGSNLNPLCQKQQWLNDHKVVWDGISNNNVC
jgi:hypothetical protein